MNQKDNNMVMRKIREYAVRQLRSWDTLGTVLALALIIYMIYLFVKYPVSIFSMILFAALLGLEAFGLFVTIPALIMFFAPYSSSAFRMKASVEEKRRMAAELSAAEGSKEYLELPDLITTDRYILLTGQRNVELMRWEDIVRLEKIEYPFRQRYKGMLFLYFVDQNGAKHELDIRNGKHCNPVRSVSRTLYYTANEHPKVEMELTETDQKRIHDMLVEMGKIKDTGELYE